MFPLDPVPKNSRKPNKIKVATDYTPNENDKKLKAALIGWHDKIHQDAWPEGDIYLGPTAMVSNQILMQLCHLAHTCAIKAPSDIANNIQLAQFPTVMKHAEDILRIIHTIIPENAVDPQQIIPVSIPKTIDPVQASVGKPLRQCSACQQWGHTSKLTIFLFFLPF